MLTSLQRRWNYCSVCFLFAICVILCVDIFKDVIFLIECLYVCMHLCSVGVSRSQHHWIPREARLTTWCEQPHVGSCVLLSLEPPLQPPSFLVIFVYMCVSEGQRTVLGIFHNSRPPYVFIHSFLSQGISWPTLALSSPQTATLVSRFLPTCGSQWSVRFLAHWTISLAWVLEHRASNQGSFISSMGISTLDIMWHRLVLNYWPPCLLPRARIVGPCPHI